ncbi:hypothetical protein J6590_047223 [Homalodisca vitripennis]|nr:hypothetical protein J6590_047223 [Homalodisca vitripennis]
MKKFALISSFKEKSLECNELKDRYVGGNYDLKSQLQQLRCENQKLQQYNCLLTSIEVLEADVKLEEIVELELRVIESQECRVMHLQSGFRKP